MSSDNEDDLPRTKDKIRRIYSKMQDIFYVLELFKKENDYNMIHNPPIKTAFQNAFPQDDNISYIIKTLYRKWHSLNNKFAELGILKTGFSIEEDF